jgi:hypothetical protein
MTSLEEKRGADAKPGLFRSLGRGVKKAVEAGTGCCMAIGLAGMAGGIGIFAAGAALDIGGVSVGFAIAQAALIGLLGSAAIVMAGCVGCAIGIALWNGEFEHVREMEPAAAAPSVTPLPSLALAYALENGPGLAFNTVAADTPANGNEIAPVTAPPRRKLNL